MKVPMFTVKDDFEPLLTPAELRRLTDEALAREKLESLLAALERFGEAIRVAAQSAERAMVVFGEAVRRLDRKI